MVVEIQSSITEFENQRNSIVDLNSESNLDTLNVYKRSLICYLRMINAIRNKLSFGNDKMSIQIEFNWFDTLDERNYYSYNISFEYLNVMFNLAICYFLIGNIILANSSEVDESKIKEAVKMFQHASFLFDCIKTESKIQLVSKETEPDMSDDFLTYVT